MHPPCKSPLKNYAKSLSNYGCSPSKFSANPLTPSKCQSQVKKQIFQSQIYKTILSKLLTKNTIQEFIVETCKFAVINDQFMQTYIKTEAVTNSTSSDFPQLGRAFLKDGSFLKHYCKLLILKQPHRRQELKRLFYQRYKDEVVQKKAYFQKFFKELIKLEQYQLSQQKLQASKREIAHSLKKSALSFKKAASQKLQYSQKVQKKLQSISAIDANQQKQTSITLQVQNIQSQMRKDELSQESTQMLRKPKKTITPIKQQESSDQEDMQFVSCRSRRKKIYLNESEEQREKRMLGLALGKSRENQAKQVGNIIKFADEISSNQRLKKIYESIKKQKQTFNQQSAVKTNKTKQQPISPVYRSSYQHLKAQFQQKKLMNLTAQILQKLTNQQRNLLKYFPNISKIAIKDKIQKDCPIIMGSLNNHIVMKAFVIDYSNRMEPTYIAVYLQLLKKSSPRCLSAFKYQIDNDVQVLLVGEFRNGQPVQGIQ